MRFYTGLDLYLFWKFYKFDIGVEADNRLPLQICGIEANVIVGFAFIQGFINSCACAVVPIDVHDECIL